MYNDFRYANDHQKEINYALNGLGHLRNAAVLSSLLMASLENGELGGSGGSNNNDESETMYL